MVVGVVIGRRIDTRRTCNQDQNVANNTTDIFIHLACF